MVRDLALCSYACSLTCYQPDGTDSVLEKGAQLSFNGGLHGQKSLCMPATRIFVDKTVNYNLLAIQRYGVLVTIPKYPH